MKFQIFFKIAFFACLLLIQTESANPSEEFLNKLKEYIDYVALQNTTTNNKKLACHSSQDCITGFYCKSNDCVAKKKEKEECLSGVNEECACNKCTSVLYSWKKICSNHHACQNNGINKFNTCKRNKDCPSGYYCENKNENGLCISKLGPERACHSDEMCECGRCLQLKFYSRQNLPPISFSVCNAC